MKKIFKNIIEFIMLLTLFIMVITKKATRKSITPFKWVIAILIVASITTGKPTGHATVMSDDLYIMTHDSDKIEEVEMVSVLNEYDVLPILEEIEADQNRHIEDITNSFESNMYNTQELQVNENDVQKQEVSEVVTSPQTSVLLASRGGFINRNIQDIAIQHLDNSMVESDENKTWIENIGNEVINIESGKLVKYPLPVDYGDNINIASFKPYEDYRAITKRSSAAYRVSHSASAYTDTNGFRRFTLQENQFTVNDSGDDYLVALGSAYTRDGIEGQRFLIVGENGMYTAKIGDHKSDLHTDAKRMYSSHGVNRQYGGLIEFIVNTSTLEKSIRNSGSVNSSSISQLTGNITAIYMIVEDSSDTE
jgi:hypothetical protein